MLGKNNFEKFPSGVRSAPTVWLVRWLSKGTVCVHMHCPGLKKKGRRFFDYVQLRDISQMEFEVFEILWLARWLSRGLLMDMCATTGSTVVLGSVSPLILTNLVAGTY